MVIPAGTGIKTLIPGRDPGFTGIPVEPWSYTHALLHTCKVDNTVYTLLFSVGHLSTSPPTTRLPRTLALYHLQHGMLAESQFEKSKV